MTHEQTACPHHTQTSRCDSGIGFDTLYCDCVHAWAHASKHSCPSDSVSELYVCMHSAPLAIQCQLILQLEFVLDATNIQNPYINSTAFTQIQDS